MFSFFGKSKGLSVTDVVWMNTAAYLKALGGWLREHPEGRILAWFEQEKEVLRQQVAGATTDNVLLAERAMGWTVADRPLLFAGHYPIRQREEQVAEGLGLKEITVYIPLDAPFFLKFGGEKVAALMQRMGMKEDEAIQHPMVSKAVRNAQDKLAHKAGNEMLASSEEEWLRLNVSATPY